MDHLLTVMRKPDERESGFIALGEMSSAVGKELKQYLKVIMDILRDAVRVPSQIVVIVKVFLCSTLAYHAGNCMQELWHSQLHNSVCNIWLFC
jgi:FKBP12-rapamycin complex-associated protein